MIHLCFPTVVEVIVETGGVSLQKPLHYLVPEALYGKVRVGVRVLVPLGKRKTSGFVVGFARADGKQELKEVIELLGDRPFFTREQLQVARWISSYYFCPLQRALRCVVHPQLAGTKPPKVKHFYPAFPLAELSRITTNLNRAPKQVAVLQAVTKNPGSTKKHLAKIAGASESVIDSLVKKGLLQVTEQELDRDPFPDYELETAPPPLNREQEVAIRKINSTVQSGRHRVFLLHGVTGSGKTEVYLHSVAAALQYGRSAIVLVPEIALTPQMVKYFKERFGGRVAVLHSRMSQGERYDQWEKIKRGEAPVVLGARSAVFAPVKNLGLIVADEEHEFTYKQEEQPRYHARAVALYRAYINNAAVVLGSATPSLESFCRVAKGGPYELLTLQERVAGRPMPGVAVVDMREEFRSGNKSIFSRYLVEKIEKRLAEGEQVILFLNRRGFNTFIVCRECGLVMKCPHCDISLTYHVQGKIQCHYCGYSQMAPQLCPACRSEHIYYLGTGTQRVEEETAKLFPAARILRMDADTTGRKKSHQEILDSFVNGEADILVGTQMVAKGLHFPGVTLVGIVSADTGLYMPDFRSSERTFQLITQVAGRSGRVGNRGEVIIQTLNPEHYAVKAAAGGDYLGFFKQEMKIRKSLYYPPYSKMARLVLAGKNEKKVAELANDTAQLLKEYLRDKSKIVMTGPAPAPLTRLRGNYRMHIMLWSKEDSFMKPAIQRVQETIGSKVNGKNVSLIIDIDPYNMM